MDWTDPKKTDTEEELLEAFRVFDPYNEGFIAEKEFTTALTTMGDKLSKDEVKISLDHWIVGTSLQGLLGRWTSPIQGIRQDDVR